MSKNTDRIIADHVVTDVLIMAAQAVLNLSDEDIAKDYARQTKIGKVRVKNIKEMSLDTIRPVVEAVAQRGGIDFKFPEVKDG